MNRRVQFSLTAIFIAITVTALFIRFRPTAFEEPLVRKTMVGRTELTQEYYWFETTRGVIELVSDDWEEPVLDPQNGRIWGDGNLISISHSLYDVDTVDGIISRRIQIQLPKTVRDGDKFDIHIAKFARNTTFAHKGGWKCSYLDDCESTVYCFNNPVGYAYRNDNTEHIGHVTIVSIENRFVTIQLDLIDDVAMADAQNGIPRIVKLQRRATIAR